MPPPDLLGCTLNKEVDGVKTRGECVKKLKGKQWYQGDWTVGYKVLWDDGTSEELGDCGIREKLDRFTVGDEVEVKFSDKKWYKCELTADPKSHDKDLYEVTFTCEEDYGMHWDFDREESCRLRTVVTTPRLDSSPSPSADEEEAEGAGGQEEEATITLIKAQIAAGDYSRAPELPALQKALEKAQAGGGSASPKRSKTKKRKARSAVKDSEDTTPHSSRSGRSAGRARPNYNCDGYADQDFLESDEELESEDDDEDEDNSSEEDVKKSKKTAAPRGKRASATKSKKYVDEDSEESDFSEDDKSSSSSEEDDSDDAFVSDVEVVKPRSRAKAKARPKARPKAKAKASGKKNAVSDKDEENEPDESSDDSDDDDDAMEEKKMKQKKRPAPGSKKALAAKKAAGKKLGPGEQPYIDACGLDTVDRGVETVVMQQVLKIQHLLTAAATSGDFSAGDMLRLQTACSGTDSPSIALTLIKESMQVRTLLLSVHALNTVHYCTHPIICHTHCLACSRSRSCAGAGHGFRLQACHVL
jgi:hypothetical protein